ncbi:aldehyde dehydrogenase [Atractiella rhizophila]|nr:aldehyde dehydrogenase [Atractiella rhizophila]
MGSAQSHHTFQHVLRSRNNSTQKMSTSSYETRLFINGSYKPSKSGKSFPFVNPSTEEVVADVHAAGAEEVEEAVAAAKAAQPAWAALGMGQRIDFCFKFMEIVKQNIDKISQLGFLQGKSANMGYFETVYLPMLIRYICGVAGTVGGHSSLNTAGFLNYTIKQPYGVVCSILPFNSPTIFWVQHVVSAILAGNSIIVKSSEKAPLSCVLLNGLLHEAGVPAGVVQTLSGDGEVGALLSSNMEIRKLCFVGSMRTGKKIAAACASSNLKKFTLELGGKTPCIVFDDADIAQAAEGAARSLQLNNGQACIMNSRIFVHDKVYDQFLSHFKPAFGVAVGAGGDPKAGIGPLIDRFQYEQVAGYLEIGKEEGTVELGGSLLENQKGFFIPPSIFTNVSDDARINREEVFGPVVVVHRFTDEEEVVRRANDTEYGLYAAVFTKNIDRALRIAQQLEAGQVGVNCTSPSGAPDLPFGGWKQSGSGRVGGPDALDAWMETKSIYVKVESRL